MEHAASRFLVSRFLSAVPRYFGMHFGCLG